MVKACVIVDPKYCSPVNVEMVVVRESERLMDGDFVIQDIKGNLLFKPDTEDNMVLRDASGSPVLTMKKMWSMHGRWEVFKGVSKEKEDLLFTVKRSHVVNVKTKIDVFLGHNKEQEICDFRVKGSLFKRSCVVYAAESDTIVAQMHKIKNQKFWTTKEEDFSVTLYPDVDSAFMASLVVILDHLIRQDRAYASFALETVLG